jgi:hypothetical protein
MTEPNDPQVEPGSGAEHGRHAKPQFEEPPVPSAADPAHTPPAMGAHVAVPSTAPVLRGSARPVGTVRSPVGGWLLALVTLGIYALFWYYNLNRELRDYDSSIRVDPALAVLSLFVPIVGLISIYNTGGRIRQAQTLAGVAPTASGGIGLVLSFVFGLYLPYYNSQSNAVWIAGGATRAR